MRALAFLAPFALGPFLVLACDEKKKDAADAGAGATPTTSTAATTAPTDGTPPLPLSAATSNTPSGPGVRPVPIRLPDGGLAAPDGGPWTWPSGVVPSNLPPMPSGLTVPTTLPSNLPPPPSGFTLPSTLPTFKPPPAPSK